jgi:hypothetical protein
MIGNSLDKLNEIINSGLFDEGIDKAWEEQLKSARMRGPKVKFAHWARNNGKVSEWSRGANKASNMEAWERHKESDAYDRDYAEWDVLLERPTGAKEEN